MPFPALRRRALAPALVLPVLALTVLVAQVWPASSQTIPEPVGGLLDDLGVIDGLSPLDPVLNPVSDLVLQISNAVADGLAETPLVNTVALQGEDAIDAGVAFSQATFPDGAGTAILSREDLFADGFSSGGFQGRFDAPLLYTDSDDLDPRTGLELQRLGMSAITILGGEDALHPLVVQKLEIAGLDVTRVGGPTRVETALEAAAVTHPGATTAVLVRAYPDEGMDDSQAYADLLAAGPYAAENGWPLLMTTSGALHGAVADYLADFDNVIVIGGTSAISQVVEDALTGLSLDVTRLAGANRFATAVEIARARGFNTVADAERIIVAEAGGRDDVWAPGFAATAHADRNAAPVLLTSGATIPVETLNFIVQGVPETVLDGGPVVVCAPFTDPLACTATGALMTANLGLVEDLLGIDLTTIPGVGDILAALGELDLLPDPVQVAVNEVVDAGGEIIDAIGDILGGVAAQDPDAVIGGAEDVGGAVGDLVGDVTGGLGGGDGSGDESGGDGSGGDGSGGDGILDPVLDPLLGGG